MKWKEAPLLVRKNIRQFKQRKNYSRWTLRTRLLDIFYDVGRFVALGDQYDINADYICGHCGKPVWQRVIYCSKSCYFNSITF